MAHFIESQSGKDIPDTYHPYVSMEILGEAEGNLSLADLALLAEYNRAHVAAKEHVARKQVTAHEVVDLDGRPCAFTQVWVDNPEEAIEAIKKLRLGRKLEE